MDTMEKNTPENTYVKEEDDPLVQKKLREMHQKGECSCKDGKICNGAEDDV